MATKEEHLWRLTLSGEIRERDLRPWICEVLAERDEHSEIAARRLAEIEELRRKMESMNEALHFEDRRADAGWKRVIELEAERDAAREELAKLKAAQPAAEASEPFSIKSTGGESVQWAEPAPPQETAQGGPFTDNGGFGWINDNGVAALKAITEEAAKRYTRLLNAGLEAEKLRAHVAELEAHVNSYARSYQDEKARADAAEKTLRLVRSDLDQLSGMYREKLRELKSAEAKLAALGENPIPRALVEKWGVLANSGMLLAGPSFVLDSILAGREPGAQQS